MFHSMTGGQTLTAVFALALPSLCYCGILSLDVSSRCKQWSITACWYGPQMSVDIQKDHTITYSMTTLCIRWHGHLVVAMQSSGQSLNLPTKHFPSYLFQFSQIIIQCKWCRRAQDIVNVVCMAWLPEVTAHLALCCLIGYLSKVLRNYTEQACDGDFLSVRCPPRTTITIQLAFYGRRGASDHQQCPQTYQALLSSYAAWEDDRYCSVSTALQVSN